MNTIKNQSSPLEKYRRYVGWKLFIIITSIVLVPILLCVSVSLGVVRISVCEIVSTLLGMNSESVQASIILQSRLPQALIALLAGAGLSITGTAMQAVLRNPLSSPFTLGISSAAAFGAACVVVFGGGKVVWLDNTIMKLGLPYGSIAFGAFVCSVLTAGLILLLAGKKHIKAETIILTGVALSAFYGAGIMLLQYIAEEQQLAAMVYWTFGDTQRGTWSMIYILAILVPAFSIWYCLQGWNYNAMSLGEESARGLGVSVRRVRGMTMFLASLLTAILVASLGIIGFVGLVVPHLCRLLIGSDNRFVLPLAFFLGGNLLLISDTTARLVLSPRLMPVSILTAFIGAPIFLLMLLRRSGSSC
ncbi:MAG: iron ABC transporter permease [Thermoguttaceae bacterium]|nr:iron ABC transporter permease [Thermoguttaceae bacterium]